MLQHTKCNDIAFTIRWCTGYYVSNGLADDIVDVCGSSFSDLVMLPVMNQSRKIGRVRQDELAKFVSDSTDVLGEVRLVKSSNGEEHELAKGNRRIDNLYHVGRKEALINSVTQPIQTCS